MDFGGEYAATDPVGLAVSAARFACYHSRGRLRWLVHRTAAALPGGVARWWLAFIWIPWLGAAILRWVLARKRLAEGALGPVVVVDAARGLCAAYADLSSNGVDVVPAVKIYEERLDLIPGGARDGQRFAAGSLFAWPDDRSSTTWKDFTPSVVDCLCDDAEGCARALARVPDEEWRALEAGLAALGAAGREPGLHLLRTGAEERGR